MAHILMLDDEEDACRLVRRVLGGSGHDITAFTEVGETLEWLRSNSPDLALLDFKLRDSDGLSVLRRMRQIRPAIKTILITGKPSPEIEAKALEMGIREYLVKPLEIGELEEHVNRVLGTA